MAGGWWRSPGSKVASIAQGFRIEMKNHAVKEQVWQTCGLYWRISEDIGKIESFSFIKNSIAELAVEAALP